MKFFDYIKMALKNLSRQKTRTILTIVAITIGSLSLILMVSLLIGIRQSIVDTFKNMGAFDLVTVTADPNSVDKNGSIISSGGSSDEGKKIDDTTLASMKNLSNVIDATPIANVWVKTIKLEGEDKKMWASLIAYDTTTNVFNLPLLAGRGLTSSDMDKIVVGGRFVNTYDYTNHPQDLIGQKVVMTYESGGGGGPDWGPLPEKPPINADESWWKEHGNKNIEITAEIIGVANNATMSDDQNYINIAWGRRLMTQVFWKYDESKKNQNCDKDNSGNCSFGSQPQLVLSKNDYLKEKGYASIIVKVDNENNVKSVAEQITKLGYGTNTAQNMIDQINRMLTAVGLVLGIIAGISLLVAAIGIINTMVMATYERIREIGVMRACGATKATIRHLFTLEAALLGFWGGVFGMIISFIIGKLGKFLAEKYGANLGNIPVENIGNFPWWLIVGVLCFTTLIGLLSGLSPAIKAARLNPVDALRYE